MAVKRESNTKQSPIKAGDSSVKRASVKSGSLKEKILEIAAGAYCNGNDSVRKDKVVALTKCAKKTIMNELAKLRKDGLVDYPDAQSISLTKAGVEHMGEDCKRLSPKEIQAKLKEDLKGKQLQMFELLKDGETWSKEDVATELGYHGKRQKGFQNLMGKMKSIGMVEYPDKDHVKMTDMWLGN